MQAGAAVAGSPSRNALTCTEVTIAGDCISPVRGALKSNADGNGLSGTDTTSCLQKQEVLLPVRDPMLTDCVATGQDACDDQSSKDAAVDPPCSARRRRRWAADMDFFIQLSPETPRLEKRHEDTGMSELHSDSTTVEIAEEPRMYRANLDFHVELSPQAPWALSADPEPLVPEDVGGEVIAESHFRIGSLFEAAEVAHTEDDANLRDEFSFAAIAHSANSFSSGAISSGASPGAISSADSATSVSSSPGSLGKKTKFMQDAIVADVSTCDASTGEASNVDGSGTVDGSATDDALIPQALPNMCEPAKFLQRSSRGGMLPGKAFGKALSASALESLPVEPTGLDDSCTASSSSASKLVTVPLESLGFIERSKQWAQQREHRLQRLREMREQVIKDNAAGSVSSQSRLRREPSPSQTRSSPSSALAASAPVGSNSGPASLFARGEAWRERKRLREKELREEAMRHEVSACTFRPDTMQRGAGCISTAVVPVGSTPPASVTPDRARRLFERQVSWRQRLDDVCERRRSEQRQAAEREIRELRGIRVCTRRASSAEPALRRSASAQARASSKADVDLVLSSLYERNCEWQRARDARIERLHDEELARILQPAERPEGTQQLTARTAHLRQNIAAAPVSAGVGATASVSQPIRACRSALLSTAAAAGCPPATATSASQPSQAVALSSSHAKGNACCTQPPRRECSTGTPRSVTKAPATARTPDKPATADEHTQVLEQLQALRRCLVSSQSRNSGTWQRTIKVENARLTGAGAAPLRSRAAAEVTPRASSAAAAVRGRTRSPATARGKAPSQAQAGQLTDRDRGSSVPPHSRDASPASRGSVRPSPRRSMPAR